MKAQKKNNEQKIKYEIWKYIVVVVVVVFFFFFFFFK